MAPVQSRRRSQHWKELPGRASIPYLDRYSPDRPLMLECFRGGAAGCLLRGRLSRFTKHASDLKRITASLPRSSIFCRLRQRWAAPVATAYRDSAVTNALSASARRLESGCRPAPSMLPRRRRRAPVHPRSPGQTSVKQPRSSPNDDRAGTGRGEQLGRQNHAARPQMDRLEARGIGAGKGYWDILELDARPGRIGIAVDDPHQVSSIRPIQLAGNLDSDLPPGQSIAAR